MSHYVGHEIEEFEFDGQLLFVNVTIKFNYYPGKPMVMYYSDGSGHPGSPDEVELDSIFIEEAYDENDDEVETTEALETAVEEYLDDNYDLWAEDALNACHDDREVDC